MTKRLALLPLLAVFAVSFAAIPTPPVMAQDGSTFLDGLELVSAKNIMALFPLLRIPMKASPHSVAFHGETLVVGLDNNTVIVCRVPCALQDEYPAEANYQGVTKALISPDGQWLAAATSSGNMNIPNPTSEILLWRLKNGRFESAQSLRWPSLNSYINDLAFSPDSSLLAAGNVDGVLNMWDGNQLQRLHTSESGPSVMTLIFSPDGTRLIAGFSTGNFLIWDVKSRQLIGQVDGNGWISLAVVLSPDGNLLASGGFRLDWKPSPEDSSIYLWELKTFLATDVTTGKPQAVFKGYISNIDAIAFTPAGDILISSSGGEAPQADGTLRFWDVVKRQQVRVIAPDYINSNYFETRTSLAFDEEGKVLASADFYRKTVTLWGVRQPQ